MKMKAPEGCTGCSYDGKEYEAVDGFVQVPDEAAAALISHGFEPVHSDAPSDPPANPALDGSVAEVAARLAGLTDEELQKALADEIAGKDRKGVKDAIAAEQEKRK